MNKLSFLGIIVFGCALGWSADYLRDGPDIGNSGWVRNEKVFNTTNVKNMKLLWKIRLDSTPREMHNLFTPLVAENVATSGGAKEIALVSGISDDLFAIDVATGKQIWHKHFDSTFTQPSGSNGSTLCPGGQLATPVIGPGSQPGRYTVYALAWDGRLRQVNLADGEDLAVPEKFMPPNAKPWGLNLDHGVIYTTVSQGCGGVTNAFFSFDLATRKASTFLPRGGGMWGRRGVAIGTDGTVYMGSGDAPYDPEKGEFGETFTAVRLDENQELQRVGWFAPPNANWLYKRDLDINVAPLTFDYKGRHFLAGSSKECRVWMVDRDNFGGASHQEMLDRSPLVCNEAVRVDARGVWGALAAWQDAAGQQWIGMPFIGPVNSDFHSPIEYGRPVNGAVAAMKVEEKNGKWQLTQAWMSHDMDQADEAVYTNGVLFVDAAGEDTWQLPYDIAYDETPLPPGGGSTKRIAGSRHATIYALDASNGKELWSSGDQITSWTHGGGMSAVNGRAYIGTWDGYFYCFGIAK